MKADDLPPVKRKPVKVTWTFIEVGPITWTMIQAFLITGKLGREVDWSWAMVLTPTIVGLALLFVSLVVGGSEWLRNAR